MAVIEVTAIASWSLKSAKFNSSLQLQFFLSVVFLLRLYNLLSI